jgi:hypothetical protein
MTAIPSSRLLSLSALGSSRAAAVLLAATQPPPPGAATQPPAAAAPRSSGTAAAPMCCSSSSYSSCQPPAGVLGGQRGPWLTSFSNTWQQARAWRHLSGPWRGERAGCQRRQGRHLAAQATHSRAHGALLQVSTPPRTTRRPAAAACRTQHWQRSSSNPNRCSDPACCWRVAGGGWSHSVLLPCCVECHRRCLSVRSVCRHVQADHACSLRAGTSWLSSSPSRRRLMPAAAWRTTRGLPSASGGARTQPPTRLCMSR